MSYKTYRVDKVNNRIVGTIDDKEAYMQFVEKALSTTKFCWEYYDQYYGIKDLQSLIGRDKGWIMAHYPKYMEECLMTDPRTVRIDNYEYNEVGTGKLYIKCVVWSIYGNQEVVKEVTV